MNEVTLTVRSSVILLLPLLTVEDLVFVMNEVTLTVEDTISTRQNKSSQYIYYYHFQIIAFRS